MISSKKILVIDDDDVLLTQMKHILEKNEHIYIEAENGEAGLTLAAAEMPDLIFLDRNMPGMDGDAVLEKLKNDDHLKDIPVIMLTGDTDINDVSSSLKLGALDYIVKPFSSDNLLMRMNTALVKHDD